MKKFFVNIWQQYRKNSYSNWQVPLAICIVGMAAIFLFVLWITDSF